MPKRDRGGAGRGGFSTPASQVEDEPGVVATSADLPTEAERMMEMGCKVMTAEEGIAIGLTDQCFDSIRVMRPPFIEVTSTRPKNKAIIREMGDLPAAARSLFEEYSSAALRVKAINAEKRAAIADLDAVIKRTKPQVIKAIRRDQGEKSTIRRISISSKPHAMVIRAGTRTKPLNKTIITKFMEQAVTTWLHKHHPERIGKPFTAADLATLTPGNIRYLGKAARAAISAARAAGEFEEAYEELDLEVL